MKMSPENDDLYPPGLMESYWIRSHTFCFCSHSRFHSVCVCYCDVWNSVI